MRTESSSFFVAFARAGDTLKAAIAAQQALATHPWPADGVVRVRMGLHTGEPIWLGNDYTGLEVHRAARLCSAGHGGQILLSQSTAALIEHHLPEAIALRDLGTPRLKDLLRPKQIFQLVIADMPNSFPTLQTLDTRSTNLPVQATALIGRERDIAAVRDLLLRADVRLLTDHVRGYDRLVCGCPDGAQPAYGMLTDLAVTKDHGRMETRRAFVMHHPAALAYLNERQRWAHLTGVALVEAERTLNG